MLDCSIVDLRPEHEPGYLACLEEYSEEMKDAGDHKAHWYAGMVKRGLRVKVAEAGNGELLGMIQYAPIEESIVEGEGLYFIYCIWVHGHKDGVGNRQKRGIGTELLAEAEQDARQQGATGMAAWGIVFPFWMKASWFKKQGYQKVERNGMAVLLYKPFQSNAIRPAWIKDGRKPEKKEGVVTVTAYINGWCPGQNIIFERAKRASAEFGELVEFIPISTFEKGDQRKCGFSDAVFVDGKSIQSGPPPSYEKIHRIIAKQAKKLQKELASKRT